jgi:hypothetical protein
MRRATSRDWSGGTGAPRSLQADNALQACGGSPAVPSQAGSCSSSCAAGCARQQQQLAPVAADSTHAHLSSCCTCCVTSRPASGTVRMLLPITKPSTTGMTWVQPSPLSTTTPVSRPLRSCRQRQRQRQHGRRCVNQRWCMAAAVTSSSYHIQPQPHTVAAAAPPGSISSQGSSKNWDAPHPCALPPPSWHREPAPPAPRCAAPARQKSQTCSV